MDRVYFHFTSASDVMVDRLGRVPESFGDLRAHAEGLVHSLVRNGGPEDWRDWMVHVSDEDGEDVLILPFAAVLGRLH